MRPVVPAAAASRLVLMALCCSIGLLTAADYDVTVLLPTSDMPPATSVVAAALNNFGQVAGYEVDPKGRRVPLVWTDAIPVKLALPAGYRSTPSMRAVKYSAQSPWPPRALRKEFSGQTPFPRSSAVRSWGAMHKRRRRYLT